MKTIIKSVQKGYGEDSIFFTTNEKANSTVKVDKIEFDSKQVGNDIIINVYKGYVMDHLVFEMGANIDVTVVYETILP